MAPCKKDFEVSIVWGLDLKTIGTASRQGSTLTRVDQLLHLKSPLEAELA